MSPPVMMMMMMVMSGQSSIEDTPSELKGKEMRVRACGLACEFVYGAFVLTAPARHARTGKTNPPTADD